MASTWTCPRGRCSGCSAAAAVDPNLTGRENLRMVGILGQLPRADVKHRAAELLERFDLTEAADRPLRIYSGGTRRRLDVAASLMSRCRYPARTGATAASRWDPSATRLRSPDATSSPTCASRQLLIFTSIQPVIFVLLFRYAFGGAVKLPVFPSRRGARVRRT
jgi:hypothetical protein